MDEKLNSFLEQSPPIDSFNCRNTAYSTDFPGVLVSNRQVYKRIEEIVRETKNEVIAESPYLVLRDDGARLIKSITADRKNFELLTNSLKSTDAYYTSAAMALKASLIEDLRVKLYLFLGQSPYSQESVFKKTERGIHSKRAVIDEMHTIIGTYNIDPRSANLNSEMVIICRNQPELAKFVKEDMRKRMGKASLMRDYTWSEVTHQASWKNKWKFYLSMRLVYFFEFLL